MTNELIEVVVQSRTEQGAGIAVIALVSTDGSPLPSFTAGAHIDVHIDDDLIRQYSLCNDPLGNDTGESDSYRIGVLNDPNSRGGSVKVHGEFNVGKVIQISAPRNLFPLNENASKTILAGGGIGITPMIAMAYQLKRENKAFELHYCCREKVAAAFQNELTTEFTDSVFFHYDNEAKEQLFSPKASLTPVNTDTHVYVCGPTGFMDWVINSAKEIGFSSAQIHFEYFSAEVDTAGETFEVYCQDSDITVTVSNGDTIAQALKQAGIKVSMSCEEGVCGTCITDVIEGEPDHRDHFLTDEEKADNDQIAVCCSRAKSKRLVLDL